jgi:hypothetical protein
MRSTYLSETIPIILETQGQSERRLSGLMGRPGLSGLMGHPGLSGPESDPRDLTDPGDLSNLA